MKKKISYLILFLLLFVFSFLTVGYALYSKNLGISGNVRLKSQGDVYIANVILSDSSNLTNASNPEFTDTSIDFNFEFNGEGMNDTYFAEYDITIVNDTFYDYEFGSSKFTPDISFGETNNATIDFTFEDITEGEIIPSGGSKTFKLIATLTPLDDSGSYSGSGSVEADLNENPKGNMLGSVTSTNSGDLTGSTITGPFTAEIVSTFENSKTFTLKTNNENFEIVLADGTPATYSIDANSTSSYNFYIKQTNNKLFATSPQNISVNLETSGLMNRYIGSVDVDVNIDTTVNDTDPPVISNVSVTQSSTNGEVTLSWTGTDENSIDYYSVLIYEVAGTTETYKRKVDTNGDETNITITGLEEKTYVFKVYGTDEIPNTASEDQIAKATTSSGVCVKTTSKTFKWIYNLTIDNSLTSANYTAANATTPSYMQTFSTTLRGTGWNGSNSHPNEDRLSISMGGSTLSSSKYSYNESTGLLQIPNVTGDITIGYNSATCLIEGTKIRLANGKYKNIEDIDYDDLVASWNYETGKLSSAYPIWIEKTRDSKSYIKVTFDDKTTLGIVNNHGLFDIDKNEFIDLNDLKVGTNIAKINEDGTINKVRVTKIETIKKQVNYYHVVTTYNYNLIANDILTTDDMVMLSNLYGFDKNIKWPSIRKEALKTNDYTYKDFKGVVPKYMYEGLRVKEVKILVDNKYLTLDEFKYYLKTNQNNKDMVKKPIRKLGKNYWPVSIDNKKYKLVKEGSYYTLPSSKNTVFIDSSNNKKYKPGEKVKVWHGIHFIEVTKRL